MRRPRRHWPALLGALLAGAVLLLFATTGLGDAARWDDVRPLGIAAHGWAVALLVIVLALLLQITHTSRHTLTRERRMVEAAAQLREASARLEQQATTDALTGLYDRRVLRERLGAEFRRSRRYGRPIALLMVDIDHFKAVNDRYGHQAGDRVLTETARLLRENVRESDLVARYGGEEFVVLLAETAEADAATVAAKLHAAVREHDFRVEGAALGVSVSVGVAGLPESVAEDEEALLGLADTALYGAKRAGRDRIVVASAPQPAPTA